VVGLVAGVETKQREGGQIPPAWRGDGEDAEEAERRWMQENRVKGFWVKTAPSRLIFF